MHRLIVLCGLAALAAPAQDRWIEFRSGPFEVWTNAGERPGRATLMRLEQFRHGLGQIVGEDELGTPLPVRVLVFRKQDPRTPGDTFLTGRDRFAAILTADAPPSAALQRDLARLLLDSNTARMPADWERGLMDLFSTLDVTGIRITLGKPPAQTNRDWARAHLLATRTEYYGRLRVILSNLRRGVPPDAAYRNAVGKGPAEIEREVDAHLAAGNFSTVPLSSRPMSERDFLLRQVSPEAARLALADLLLPDARAAYEAMVRDGVNVPEAHEGLGILALREGRKDDALRHLAAATQADSRSARCWLEYGRLESDSAKAVAALKKAAELNPKLAEPHFEMAQRETDPAKRVESLKKAAELAPRELPYWEALARIYLEQKDFSNAARAWTAAEQAAADDADRARMREARAAIEGQRLDHEAAERKRAAEEKERELARLKDEALAHVRELEARANTGTPESKPGETVVPWWDGPKPEGRVRGMLRQVDCIGKQARLVIDGEDGKQVRLLVSDASGIAISGGGQQVLGCGPLKPRRVVVEYFPRPNSKLATAGEVATIEFQ
jgi:tetratricopeptide (TPR) repeat protein